MKKLLLLTLALWIAGCDCDEEKEDTIPFPGGSTQRPDKQ